MLRLHTLGRHLFFYDAFCAYDLATTFKSLCLSEEFQGWNEPALGCGLWTLPAELVKHGNANVLRLPAR